MQMQKSNFVKTKDKKIRDVLLASGFTEITETGSEYFSFINDGIIKFDKDMDAKKVIYTNVMCL